jgi:hypothetical protein
MMLQLVRLPIDRERTPWQAKNGQLRFARQEDAEANRTFSERYGGFRLLPMRGLEVRNCGA